MKILIENAAIITMDSRKPFIENGYIYIDHGVIVDYGEGLPSPELELAEYVINDRYSVAMPGFSVGLADPIAYAFRGSRACLENLQQIIDTLTPSDVENLVGVALASLAGCGTTSVVFKPCIIDARKLIAVANGAAWSGVRTRLLLSLELLERYAYSLDNVIKEVLRSIRDSEALSKKLITFGIYIDAYEGLRRLEGVSEANVPAYVHGAIFEKHRQEILSLFSRVAVVDPQQPPVENGVGCIYTDIKRWRPPCALTTQDPEGLSPVRLLIPVFPQVGGEEALRVLTLYNSSNLLMAPGTIQRNTPADIVMLAFRAPPHGPILMESEAIFSAIATAQYTVNTVIVGGDVVLDDGLPLTVGEERVRRVHMILNDVKRLCKKR